MDYPFNKLKYVEQRLFQLTQNFTLEDWEAVRGEGYWEARDAMPKKEDRDYFLLTRVEAYIGEEE